MKSSNSSPCRTLLQLLAFMSAFRHGHALSQAYCSSENTGSDYSAVSNIYNSNGACQTQCADSYAFAVVQYQQCWCSNYAPGDTVDVSECSTSCPGYPDESCGNSDDGLYGYIALNKSPSGTVGASSAAASSTQASTSQQATSTTSEASTTQQPTSSSSSSPSSSYSPSPTSSSQTSEATVYSSVSVTVYSTVQQSASVVVSYVTLSSSSESSTTPTSTSTSTTPAPTTSSTSTTPYSTTSSSETTYVAPITTTSDTTTAAPSDGTSWTHTTLVSTRVVTVEGAPVTQTVTSTPMVINSAAADQQKTERKGVSGGTIAGAVVGALLGVALLLAGVFFLWRRRKSNASESDSTASASARRKMERNTSVLSKTGLLSAAGAGHDVEKSPYDGLGFINTGAVHSNNNQRHSAAYGGESGGPSPISPAGDSGSQRTRRDSRPLVFDQRLNPAAIMSNWEANGSRASVGTMQDQRDYSRPLGVTNPDPIDD